MIIYIFYFKDKDDNRELEPFLYAYTGNKDLANRFMEFRDMSKFRLVKREISQNQYNDFSRQYPSQQLTKTKFLTKSDDTMGKSYVEIVCTWDEEKNSIMNSDDTVFTLFKDKMFNPRLLSLDLKIDLHKLGFFTIYQYLYQQMYIYEPLLDPEFSGIFSADIIAGDIIKPLPNNLKTDEFEMFMYLYNGTIKEQ